MAAALRNQDSNTISQPSIVVLNALPTINVAGSSLPIPGAKTMRTLQFPAVIVNNTLPVLSVPNFGDIYGLDSRDNVVVVYPSTSGQTGGNLSTACSTSPKTKVVSQHSRTTSAEKARETDDRVVHLGLFVALLGVLSVVL